MKVHKGTKVLKDPRHPVSFCTSIISYSFFLSNESSEKVKLFIALNTRKFTFFKNYFLAKTISFQTDKCRLKIFFSQSHHFFIVTQFPADSRAISVTNSKWILIASTSEFPFFFWKVKTKKRLDSKCEEFFFITNWESTTDLLCRAKEITFDCYCRLIWFSHLTFYHSCCRKIGR